MRIRDQKTEIGPQGLLRIGQTSDEKSEFVSGKAQTSAFGLQTSTASNSKKQLSYFT